MTVRNWPQTSEFKCLCVKPSVCLSLFSIQWIFRCRCNPLDSVPTKKKKAELWFFHYCSEVSENIFQQWTVVVFHVGTRISYGDLPIHDGLWLCTRCWEQFKEWAFFTSLSRWRQSKNASRFLAKRQVSSILLSLQLRISPYLIHSFCLDVIGEWKLKAVLFHGIWRIILYDR